MTSDWDVPGTVKQDLQGTSWGRWRGKSSGRPGDQYLAAGRLVFFPNYFTRDKNGFILQRTRCSCAINQIKTGTLYRILNYSTEHLKEPSNNRELFVIKDSKRKPSFFFHKTSKYLNGIPLHYPWKIRKSLPEYLISQDALALSSNYNPEHVSIPSKKSYL